MQRLHQAVMLTRTARTPKAMKVEDLVFKKPSLKGAVFFGCFLSLPG